MDKTNNGTAIIVGASLSGLMTAIALAEEGIDVTVLDKVSGEPRTGSGLQIDSGTFELSRTARLLRKLASGGKSSVQLWSSIEGRLRDQVEHNQRINLVYNSRVESVNQNDDSAWVVTVDGEIFEGDILIGADGHRSLIRHHIVPNKPDAKYAGYIVWIIDTINESEIQKEHETLHLKTGVKMLNGLNGFMFGSVLDDKDASGNRQIGCAWYDNSRTDVLRQIGSVVDNVVNHSLDGPDIPDHVIEELKSEAHEAWPEPWLSATLYALETRKLTGIPIKEYVPDKLSENRIALIGDAAHVPAPITASGLKFRDHIIHLGITSMSAASKTNPGGYSLDEESLEQFEISDERSTEEIKKMIQSKGYETVWKDWEKTF